MINFANKYRNMNESQFANPMNNYTKDKYPNSEYSSFNRDNRRLQTSGYKFESRKSTNNGYKKEENTQSSKNISYENIETEQEKINALKELQITEKYGANTFVSASMRSFNINKLLLTFCEFDKNTNKRTKKIDIYVDFEDFLRIYSGIFEDKQYVNSAYANFKNKGDNKYAKEVHLLSGGTSAESLRRQGKERDDKQPEYRGLTLTYMKNNKDGIDIPMLYFRAITGAGKSNGKTGGISLQTVESFIGVAFTVNELSGFLKLCNSYISSYINQRVSKLFT